MAGESTLELAEASITSMLGPRRPSWDPENVPWIYRSKPDTGWTRSRRLNRKQELIEEDMHPHHAEENDAMPDCVENLR